MSKLSKETPLEKQQNGVWNVRDFGAVGDGIHKDTQAIQSAINACSASGGGIIRISSGTYRQPFPGIGAAIHVQECDDVSVHGVRAAHGTAAFFLSEDMPQGARICCTGNDLREAETAFEPQLSPLRLDTMGNVFDTN